MTSQKNRFASLLSFVLRESSTSTEVDHYHYTQPLYIDLYCEPQQCID